MKTPLRWNLPVLRPMPVYIKYFCLFHWAPLRCFAPGLPFSRSITGYSQIIGKICISDPAQDQRPVFCHKCRTCLIVHCTLSFLDFYFNKIINRTTSSPKQIVRQQLQWPIIFYPCQGKNCIPSFSIRSHLHQNSKTNSMSPEGICLFFTNFSLVSISQHNANSNAIFRHNSTLFPTIKLSHYSIDFFAFRWPSVISRSTNQLPRSPYLNHVIHSRILF